MVEGSSDSAGGDMRASVEHREWSDVGTFADPTQSERQRQHVDLHAADFEGKTV